MAPRLPRGGARASTPKPDTGPAPIGDNSQARERQEQAQLLSYVQRLRGQKTKTAVKKAEYDAEKASETEIFRLAKAAGFQRKDLEELITDLSVKRTSEVNDREIRRRRYRSWLGLSVGEVQADLEERMPQEARDEVYWAQEGHRAGLAGGDRTKLPEGMDPRFAQIYLSNFDKGKDAFIEITAANVPKAAGTTAQQIADQAKADYAADNPEVDIAAAARKLKNDPAFMARGAPAEDEKPDEPEGERCEECGALEGHEDGCIATIPNNGPIPPPVDKPFEASPEELAAQTTRQAVVEGRGEEPEVV